MIGLRSCGGGLNAPGGPSKNGGMKKGCPIIGGSPCGGELCKE